MDPVTEYISAFPAGVQQRLAQIRVIIREEAPEAEESMAYGMPAYKTQGMSLVYFAGYEKHIGFYATPTGHAQFAPELASYRQGKGSVQFPLDQPMPYDLIRRIVAFRAGENRLKAANARQPRGKS